MKRHPELSDALARALASAKAFDRPANVFDLFASLLQVSSVERMIRETGGDAQGLAARLLAAADDQERNGGFLRFLPPRLSGHLSGGYALRRALAIAAHHRERISKADLRPEDVFVAGYSLNNSTLASLLAGAGISRLRLLRWLSGWVKADSPDPVPDGDPLDVVVLNDDFTTMATVVDVLESVFEMGALRAYKAMLAVHHDGSATVGCYPRAEAIHRMNLATGMAEAADAPLKIVLRQPEQSAALARAIPNGTGTSAAAGSEPAPTGARQGFFLTLARRLGWWTVRAEGVASSEAMIIACAGVGIAVWLAFDRYAAGPDAYWYPGGITGISWYAAGMLALAWVMHRATRGAVSFRAVLAAIVGGLPLPLALGLAARSWAPDSIRVPAYALLGVAGIVYLSRSLANAGAGRRLGAMLLAGSAAALIFAWGTSQAFVDPHLWYANHDDGVSSPEETERLLFEQSDRIDTAVARLRGGEPDRPDVFFLGFAGVGEQKVFSEEIQLAERVVSERYAAADRSLLLVNDRRDRETWLFATVHGLRRALTRIGERMDRAEDVLFLMLTSHGSADPSLSVSNGTWPLEQLDGKTLRSALEKSRIRWRVIVISACHSGAFIPLLADENTVILTSAAGDRSSFGCSDDREVTDFGAAFIRDALPQAPSLASAFDRAKRTVGEREKREGVKESLPQAHFGAAIGSHWERIETARTTTRAR